MPPDAFRGRIKSSERLSEKLAPATTRKLKCRIDGGDSANFDARPRVAGPTPATPHDCLDDCGSHRCSHVRLDGAKSCAFGFGGDSAIELLSAIVVLWRFRSTTLLESRRAEKTAARLAGALLFLVAAFVLITSSLAFIGYSGPRPSLVGIGLLIVAALGMP